MTISKRERKLSIKNGDASPLPKISIVIPTLNAGAYLGECLLTIRKQCYPSVEVIVVDGQSTDNTLEICSLFKDIVKVIVSEPAKGQPSAVSKGLTLCTGEIVHWHAADDVVLPGAFQTVADAFEKHPECELVFGDGLAFDGNAIFSGETVRWLRFWPTLLHQGRFQSDCAYWRRTATASALPLDDSKPLNCDEDFFLRMWVGRRSLWVKHRLGAFRIRDGQLSAVLDRSVLARDRNATREKILSSLGIAHWKRLGMKCWAAPYYLLGHVMLPKFASALRYTKRLADRGAERREFTRWLHEDWLRTQTYE